MKQKEFLKKENKSYGGDLLKTRKGRAHGRPIVTTHSMHLVLRSSKAIGDWSFWRPRNREKIQRIVSRFSSKYGVKIHSLANVGNHIHFQMKLSNRHTYKSFIRAITSAIAMAVTGASRWNPLKKTTKDHFWDYRPYTRVVIGLRAFLTLRNYIEINKLEGLGLSKNRARFFLKWNELNLIENNSS